MNLVFLGRGSHKRIHFIVIIQIARRFGQLLHRPRDIAELPVSVCIPTPDHIFRQNKFVIDVNTEFFIIPVILLNDIKADGYIFLGAGERKVFIDILIQLICNI